LVKKSINKTNQQKSNVLIEVGVSLWQINGKYYTLLYEAVPQVRV